MTLTCPAGCQYAVSLNDSGYPAEHDEHRSMTAMIDHLADEHPGYVRAAWQAKAERDYFERVILPDEIRRVESNLSSRLPDGYEFRYEWRP